MDETSIYDWSPLIRHQTRSKILALKRLTGAFFRTYCLRGILRPWGTSVELLSAEVQGNRPFDLVLAADCSALPARAKSLEQARKSRCSCSNNVLV